MVFRDKQRRYQRTGMYLWIAIVYAEIYLLLVFNDPRCLAAAGHVAGAAADPLSHRCYPYGACCFSSRTRLDSVGKPPVS